MTSSLTTTPAEPPRPIRAALTKLLWGLTYLLPAVLFFSYYPIISLGANASMNFELSLPLIWLVLFDITAFATLLTFRPKPPKASKPQKTPNPQKPSRTSKILNSAETIPRNLPGISDRRIFLFSIFPFFLTLSVFWSKNPLRGLLTAGIIWLLFFAIFAIIYLLPLLKSPKNLKTHLLLSLFISTTFVCIFCFIQSILDTCGLPRTETLLCAGCTYRSFGFPHPSGFAIEPQFMGNLLLAPTLTALYLLTFRPKPQKTLKTPNPQNPAQSPESAVLSNPVLTLAALLFSTTLFFTFSRGAIYAYAVALLVLFIFALIRKSFRLSLIIIPVATFLLSLGLQGTFAALGPTSETFTSAITKSIHQLSLGLVDLRSLANAKSPQATPDNSPETPSSSDPPTDQTQASTSSETPETTPEPPYFEGYVAESTNIRLNLNETALLTALKSPRTLLFGVGLGGAGTAMFEAFPDKVSSPKEIVQNQAFSLLLETGLLGLFLAHFLLVLAFFAPLLPLWFTDGKFAAPSETSQSASQTLKTPTPSLSNSAPTNTPARKTLLSRLKTSDFWSHPALPLLAALIIAYIITLNFFSGLPNALQVYLMPPLLFFIFRRPDTFQESL